jgi:hypothetical protein
MQQTTQPNERQLTINRTNDRQTTINRTMNKGTLSQPAIKQTNHSPWAIKQSIKSLPKINHSPTKQLVCTARVTLQTSNTYTEDVWF